MTLPVSIISKPSIELAHHKTHEGNHFDIHKIITGVTIANPKYILIIPPPLAVNPSNTIEIHVIFEVESINIGFTLELFENSDATGLTALIPINLNRRSTTTALTDVYEDLTVLTSVGTPLYEKRVGTTTSGGEAGAYWRDEEELIFKPGSKYLIRVTPLADGLNGNIDLNWYDNRPSSPIPIP